MFRNYVFRIHGESFSSRGCDNGRARSQDWHKRKERKKRRGSFGVWRGYSGAALVHPLRKIKGAKMRGKKERLFRIKRASMQSEMGKCYWVNADSRLKEKTL